MLYLEYGRDISLPAQLTCYLPQNWDFILADVAFKGYKAADKD